MTARDVHARAVVGLRLGVGVEPRGGVAGHRRVREGLRVLARFGEVTDELRRDLLQTLPRGRFDHLGDPSVGGLPVLREERPVRRLLREGVPEREVALRAVLRHPDQVPALQLVQILAHLRPIDDGDEQPFGERPADDGGGLRGPAGRPGQPIETDRDQALDRVGDRDLLRVPGHPPAVVRALDEAAVDQRARHLLEEEGVALRLAEDPVAVLVGHPRDREEGLDQLVALLRRERLEVEHGRVLRELGLDPLPEPPRDGLTLGTERDQDHDRRVHDQLGRRPDQVERGVVAPVQVLEDDQAPSSLRDGRSHDELGRLTLELLALEGRLVRQLHAEERPRDPFAPRLPPFEGDRLHQRRDLRPHRLGVVRFLDAGALADQPAILRVGLHRVVGDAPPEVPSAVVARLQLRPDRVGLLDQPALAETGVAAEEQHASATLLRTFERGPDDAHLVLASDERRVQPPRGANGPRGIPPTEHAVGRDRLALPLELDAAERLDLEQVA